MAFHLPPPKNKKQQGEQAAYKNYINSHAALRPYAQQIYKAAKNYGLDPVYFASLINFESGGDKKAHSSADAYGLAQIHMPTWVGKTDPRTGRTITRADISNPTWNLGFGAYLFSQALNKYGSYQAAYKQGYNPGYTGRGPFADVPKGYVPTGTTKSPQEQAQRTVETGAAEKDITDPFVTIRHGKLVKTNERNALHIFGQAVRRSQVIDTWQNLNDLYLAYTGKSVTLRAVKDILASGKSRYQVIDILSRGPNFVGSPVWKQNAPGYEAVWKSIYGQDSKPDVDAVKYAIVNNLGGEGFASTLRSRPDYENSMEFKGNEATLSTVYTKIFGVPDDNGMSTVKQATRQGQSPDEFASWLRTQPEYKQSGEFKSRVLNVASALGFVTGHQATLNDSTTGGPPQPASPSDPNAKPAGVI